MTEFSDLLRFVASSFNSVWGLELVLALKRDPREWRRGELVTVLRASDLVVSRALDALLAAGLVSLDSDCATYRPVNADVAARMDEVEKLYAARPDAVRRAIVANTGRGATAFADAFKLRKD
ncbi:MAG: hypothetical protein ABIO80_08255 [Sphingomicrobium sp.]